MLKKNVTQEGARYRTQLQRVFETFEFEAGEILTHAFLVCKGGNGR